MHFEIYFKKLLRKLYNATKIKNSDFAIVPRAGHLTPLENPGGFNDLLVGFLKRNFG